MTQTEFDVSEWLLNNRDSVEYIIKSSTNEFYDMLPTTIYEIYIDNYKQHVLKLIRDQVRTISNMNNEELLVLIDENFISKLYGYEILTPQYIKEKYA